MKMCESMRFYHFILATGMCVVGLDVAVAWRDQRRGHGPRLYADTPELPGSWRGRARIGDVVRRSRFPGRVDPGNGLWSAFHSQRRFGLSPDFPPLPRYVSSEWLCHSDLVWIPYTVFRLKVIALSRTEAS